MTSKLVSSLKPFHRNTLKRVAIRLQSTLANAVEQSLFSAPETHVSETSNGLRVASEDNGSETCTVGLWIDTGSRFENPSVNGISHFVEHMIFKGTQNRTQLQLEAEIEKIGAHLGAYTSREQIAYYAKCLKKDLPAVVNILGDVVQNPLFDEEAIEKERSIILQELEDVDTEEVVLDHVHASAYQGTSLGMSVLGQTANIKSITKSDLYSYISTQFSTPRIALAAAGGVDHNTLVKLAEENFGNLATSVGAEGEISRCRFTGSAIDDRNDSLPHAHISIAVEGCAWTDIDYIPLMIAKTIIGSWNCGMAGAGNMFGSLSKTAYTEHICESYNAFNISYRDTGLFGAHMVCDKMMIDDCIFIIQSEWMRLCTSVSDSDVARAKLALQTNLLTQLDDSTDVCADIGQQMLAHGRRIPLLELSKRIDMFTKDDVKKVCTEYIYDKCPVVAGVGPTEGLTDYSRIRGNMYWLRL